MTSSVVKSNPGNEGEDAVEAARTKALKEFTSKIVATIGNEGTQYGCLVSEAIRLFDKDWHEGFVSHMSKLECSEPVDFLRKVQMNSSKINVFLDQQNRWRVVVVKNDANKDVLGFIDANIYRQKNGIKKGRSMNIIPLRNQANYDRPRQGRISFAEAAVVANPDGSVLPVRRPNYAPPSQARPGNAPSMNNNRRSRFANSQPAFARQYLPQPPPRLQWPFQNAVIVPKPQPLINVVQKQSVKQLANANDNNGFQQNFSQSAIQVQVNVGIGTSSHTDWGGPSTDWGGPSTDLPARRTPNPLSISMPNPTEGGRRVVSDRPINGFYNAGARLFKDQWKQIEAQANRESKPGEKPKPQLALSQSNTLNSSAGLSSLGSSLTNQLAAMDLSTGALAKKNNNDKEEGTKSAAVDAWGDVPEPVVAADSSVNESLLAPLPDNDDLMEEEEEDDW